MYLAVNLRNVGSGIGVCQGWAVKAGFVTTRTMPTHTPEGEFRPQSRDLYIPAGDVGMWQGALRNPDDRVRAEVVEAIEARQPISIELLYSDKVEMFSLPKNVLIIGTMNRADRSVALVDSAMRRRFARQCISHADVPYPPPAPMRRPTRRSGDGSVGSPVALVNGNATPETRLALLTRAPDGNESTP